jgi:hypothetical protein
MDEGLSLTLQKYCPQFDIAIFPFAGQSNRPAG